MNTQDFIANKYKLNIGREHIIEIPNMIRNDLARLFYELGFVKGAEIGVEKGAYSEILCKANPKLLLYCIDPYSNSAYEANIEGIDYRNEHFSETFNAARERLAPYNAKIIRKTSVRALADFEDNSLDFVYIDGNHSFVNVATDLHEWKKKVKVGGIVSGHDYAYYPSLRQNHVKYVLLAYAKAYGIRPLFIVGAQAVGERGIARDRFRSWFFIKNE